MTTIGVFDSGFGGLTVLGSLLKLNSPANYVYLGDTARLPYGSKSQETIARYAVSSARFLLDHGAELLVIACNTATALALDEIRAAAAPVPVIGVIEPGVEAAMETAKLRGGSRSAGAAEAEPWVLVLATQATVQSHAYAQALARRGMPAIEKACPLLVPLVEEGWMDHPVTREVARIYLSEALGECPSISTLLLGCTHYPLLRPLLEQTLAGMGRPLTIIDSAEATAQAVGAERLGGGEGPPGEVQCTFYATDSVEKFERLGSQFLGRALPHVHLVDLGG